MAHPADCRACNRPGCLCPVRSRNHSAETAGTHGDAAGRYRIPDACICADADPYADVHAQPNPYADIYSYTYTQDTMKIMEPVGATLIIPITFKL